MECGRGDSNVGKKSILLWKEQKKTNKSEIISMLMNYNLMTTIDSVWAMRWL